MKDDMTRRLYLKLALATLVTLAGGCASTGGQAPARADVLADLTSANDYWQRNHAPQQWAFWDVAAYHTGNMAAYALTRNGLPRLLDRLGRA